MKPRAHYSSKEEIVGVTSSGLRRLKSKEQLAEVTVEILYLLESLGEERLTHGDLHMYKKKRFRVYTIHHGCYKKCRKQHCNEVININIGIGLRLALILISADPTQGKHTRSILETGALMRSLRAKFGLTSKSITSRPRLNATLQPPSGGYSPSANSPERGL